MKKYEPVLTVVLPSLLLMSCNKHTNADTNATGIKQIEMTDMAFSDLSKQKGMKSAFLYFMDSDAVFLRPNRFPLKGADARSYLENINDSVFTLTWQPLSVEMSTSADLGDTYGLYTFSGKDTTYEGTYLTIWKRQKDGSWKYVLDTGNPGIGKK